MTNSQEVAAGEVQNIQRPVREPLDAVVTEMRRIIVSDFPLIEEVNAHLMGLQGKMFRPTLLLLTADACGGVRDEDITLAAVVELIHLATLVHDDSVDHSVLRRGQPTVNAMFSHQIAVIMGDYLYSRAIIELVECGEPAPLQVMSRVTNEMTVGEMRELISYDSLAYTEDDYNKLILAKTASLMAGACDIGARRAGDETRKSMRRFGELLGCAFQVTDDVLDYTEDESVTGKPGGLDLKEHKVTLPLIAARPHLGSQDEEVVRRLLDDPEPSDEDVARVIEIVRVAGGVDVARQRAGELAEAAEMELLGLRPSAARDSLRDCVAYAVNRRS